MTEHLLKSDLYMSTHGGAEDGDAALQLHGPGFDPELRLPFGVLYDIYASRWTGDSELLLGVSVCAPITPRCSPE